jgi:signal transduction histidine kinase/ActR/RegA family two-component response regulator
MRLNKAVVALLVLSVAIPSGLLMFSARESYSRILQDAERDVTDINAILREHIGKLLQTQELLLDRVSDMVAGLDDTAIATPEFSQRLRLVSTRLEQTLSLWVTSATGDALAASLNWQPGLNVANMDYFQAQQARAIPDYIGLPYIGRTTGQPSFAMSRRRPSADDSFNGTIHVALSPAYFERYFSMVERSQPGVAALFRRDGTILARFPGGTLGTRLPPHSPMMVALAREPQAGLTSGKASTDGVLRLYAYSRLDPFDVYVANGTDMAARMAAWQQAIFREGLLYALASLVLIGATLLIWRSARSQARSIRNDAELRRATDRAEHEAQALQALGRIAGGVAHDVNNRLTVMIANLDMLDKGTRAPELREAIHHAQQAVAGVTRLIASLRAFAGGQILSLENVDLASFLAEERDWMQEAASADLKLVLDCAPGLPPCRFDKAQLRACIGNLIANARAALAPGMHDTVTLSASAVALDAPALIGNEAARPGRFVALEVADHGVGMPADVLGRALEPFFSTRAEGSGAGLGLPQVHGLMRQMGGHMAINSAPGHGTAVTLYLPVANDALQPVETASEQRRPARVLVVDDQPDVLTVANRALTRAGYEVVAVTGGSEAMRLLERDNRFDILLSDVVMPNDVDGISLVRWLRDKHPQIRAVLMSGWTQENTEYEALAAGFVAKPFSRDGLVAAIDRKLAMGPRVTSD